MEQESMLVVGDPALCDGIIERLRTAGHDVDHALHGEDAIVYLQVRPDCTLVLASLDLPGHRGRSLLQTLSQEFPGVPIISFAARRCARRIARAFRNGAFDFLSWPTDQRSLLSTVTVAREHGRMRRQSLTYRRTLEDLISERTGKLRVAMSSLERSYDITLEAMGDALDLRDAETQGHSQRVTAYTIALARAMRLSREDLKIIARGAFLHDIGKIAIPDAILLKPGKLTPAETAIMREHCQRGYDMVRKIPFLGQAAEIVHAHQEAFDGSGYPRGLTGEEIPLGARIFAIADTLDAMTSDRPYRAGLPFADAAREIERCQNTQFDPEIVAVFLSLPIESWQNLRNNVAQHTQPVQLFHSAAA
jgi:putative nucleotidyltransferase with HDIG domain